MTTDPVDDLTEHRLAAFTEPRTDEERAAFRIDSDVVATWALRKLAAYRSEIDRLDARLADEIVALKVWHDDRTRSIYGHAAFFERALIDYRMRLERDDPKLPQTYHVPGGSIVRRKGSRRIVPVDADALTWWAWQHDHDALNVSPRVSRFAPGNGYIVDEEAGKVTTGDGEIVPGVVVERDPDQYGARTEATDG